MVLSRKKGERLIIGEDIAIEVVEVRGDRVRLGLEAPDYVSIVREELLDVLREQAQRETRLARAAG